MKVPDGYIQGNKEAWEEAFEHRSADWGLDILPRLQSERLPFVAREVAAELEAISLTGKTVGQFCCNNGRELLALVKHGAKSGVGFDLAENQVAFANRTAEALQLECAFVATSILEIDQCYDDRFDLLLITIGSLCWFQELPPFFEKAARCVKKGGIVLIHETHPVTNMLAVAGDENYDEQRPERLLNSYFHKTWIETDGMHYMTQARYESKPFTGFSHSLSAIFSAALDAGLEVTKFLEFERDISGGDFAAVENKGIPLSFLLRLQR